MKTNGARCTSCPNECAHSTFLTATRWQYAPSGCIVRARSPHATTVPHERWLGCSEPEADGRHAAAAAAAVARGPNAEGEVRRRRAGRAPRADAARATQALSSLERQVT